MPRILHLITTLDRGGTERLVLTLALAQRRAGCAVEVAVLQEPGAAAAEFAARGLRVHHLGLKRKLDVGAWWRLRRLLRQHDFDILHTHLDLADLYGPFACRQGRPWVVSSRHNTDEWRRRRTWKRWPFLLWERAAHRRAARTIAVSQAVKDFLVREEGLQGERFAVVHNGIDAGLFRQPTAPEVARRSLRERLQQAGSERLAAALQTEPLRPDAGGRGGSPPLLLFAGRLAAQKGADVLLAALAAAAGQSRLVVCGEGPEKEALQHQVEILGLQDRVAFLGYQDDLAALMPAFDLFVMPSRWEGFGLVAVEAMAAGLPVVASACDGLREVVVDGETGRLVPPGDIAALAAAIDAVAADRPQAARLGQAGRRRAQARFSDDAMAESMLEQYRQVLAGAHDTHGWDLPSLLLTDRQVRSMWRGILPAALFRLPPGAHLAAQQRDYAAVASHVEQVVPLAGRVLLDLGCGLGSLLLEAQRRGARVCGVEPDGHSLALSQQRLLARQHGSAPLAVAIGEQLPLADASVDVLTCCSVLEHVREPLSVLQEAARVLKPGGVLYLGVPNALRFQERHYKVFLPPRTPRLVARAYLRLRRRDPAFLNTLHEMTPGKARRLVRSAGLEILQDPVGLALKRLEQVAGGQHRPAGRRGRLLALALTVPGGLALVRGLLRRGFFVDGAVVARRPEAAS